MHSAPRGDEVQVSARASSRHAQSMAFGRFMYTEWRVDTGSGKSSWKEKSVSCVYPMRGAVGLTTRGEVMSGH